MVRRLCIEVPATAAGLGPGTGTLGLALNVVDVVRVELDAESPEIAGEDALCDAYRRFPNDSLPGARFEVERRILAGKGLGDGTAPAVAGLAAAAHASETKEAREIILRTAANIGGDVARTAAAVMGGLTAAFRDGDEVRALHVANHLAFDIALFMPDSPEDSAPPGGTMPIEEAIDDLGRLAYLTTALIWGRWDQISIAMRGSAAGSPPRVGAVIEAATDAGAYGAFVSGPSVVAFAPLHQGERIAEVMSRRAEQIAWAGQTLVTGMREAGVTFEEEKEGDGDT